MPDVLTNKLTYDIMFIFMLLNLLIRKVFPLFIVDLPILMIWMNPFLVLGFPGECFFYIVFCIEVPVNSVDPDQMQHLFVY